MRAETEANLNNVLNGTPGTRFYSLEDIEVFMLRKFERAHKANNRMRMGDISAALEILRELQRGDME